MVQFLNGQPTFQVIVTTADLKRIFAGVDEALGREGARLVERLGRTAVEFLQAGERGLGRDYLARHWRKGPARAAGDTVSVTVYNDAENVEIPNTDPRGRRPPGYRHRILGANLLTILEYGASPHGISPTFVPARGAALLRFLAPTGGVKSFMGGTARGRGGLGAFVYGDPAEHPILAERVDHPGVSGDHLIRDAQREVESRLAQEVSAVMRGVTASLV